MESDCLLWQAGLGICGNANVLVFFWGDGHINAYTCFFLGHRDAPDSLIPALAETVEHHITEYGVGEFVVGRYGHFDYLAAQAVIEAKTRHPDVLLVYLRPYHPADRPIETPHGFDSSFYPPGMETVPKPLAIIRANRYMIDNSDYLITYAWRNPSNACKLVSYARQRERQGLIQVTAFGHK